MAPAAIYWLNGETIGLQPRAGATAKPSEVSRRQNATRSTPSDGSFYSPGQSATAVICGMVIILAILCFLWWLGSKRWGYKITPDSITKQTSKKAWHSSLTDRETPVSPYMLNQDSCSICLEHIKCVDNIRPLPCDHIFHQQCFDKWFWKTEQAIKCPLCRVEFIDEAKWPRTTRPAYTARYERSITAWL